MYAAVSFFSSPVPNYFPGSIIFEVIYRAATLNTNAKRVGLVAYCIYVRIDLNVLEMKSVDAFETSNNKNNKRKSIVD